MAKVITFSRQFPAYHSKAGQPTYFVEKFIKSIGLKYLLYDEEREFNPRLSLDEFEPKYHTIRAGHRFKAGDYFSPRVWSGNPYRSKQIVIAPDIEIKKVWDFKTNRTGQFFINGVLCSYKTGTSLEIAKNDGLTFDDLWHWLKMPDYFKGQIICWNENINY